MLKEKVGCRNKSVIWYYLCKVFWNMYVCILFMNNIYNNSIVIYNDEY